MESSLRASNKAVVQRFREQALALPAAYESSHMGAPDFRIGDRIFATLAYAARGMGTLKVTREQQAFFLADAPRYFEPAPGGWGRMGMTLIRLDAPAAVVTDALRTAYNHVAQGSKRTARKKATSLPEA